MLLGGAVGVVCWVQLLMEERAHGIVETRGWPGRPEAQEGREDGVAREETGPGCEVRLELGRFVRPGEWWLAKLTKHEEGSGLEEALMMN
jgi:hypothetical protein